MRSKYYSFLLIVVAYSIFLVLINFVHFSFFKVNVVFYSAIFDGILTSIVFLICIYFIKIYGSFEKMLIFMILLLIGYIYAISIPTVIDRSLSFYILEKLEQRGGGILKNRFEDVFVKEYMKEHRLVDVRLTEQIESGTIKIENGCVKLTSKGYFITKMSRLYRTHFLPKKRLLMGEYSDDLVDPFKKSDYNVDYICK